MVLFMVLQTDSDDVMGLLFGGVKDDEAYRKLRDTLLFMNEDIARQSFPKSVKMIDGMLKRGELSKSREEETVRVLDHIGNRLGITVRYSESISIPAFREEISKTPDTLGTELVFDALKGTFTVGKYEGDERFHLQYNRTIAKPGEYQKAGIVGLWQNQNSTEEQDIS